MTNAEKMKIKGIRNGIWFNNLTGHDGLWHTTIWEGSIGNRLEKRSHFEKHSGWLDKPSVCHCLSQSDLTNEINKPYDQQSQLFNQTGTEGSREKSENILTISVVLWSSFSEEILSISGGTDATAAFMLTASLAATYKPHFWSMVEFALFTRVTIVISKQDLVERAQRRRFIAARHARGINSSIRDRF